MDNKKKLKTFRQLKVYYGFTQKKYNRIPVIRLAGNYVKMVGFSIGDMLDVKLQSNRIVITKKLK